MTPWLRHRGWPLLVFAAGLAFVYRQALTGEVYFGRDALRFFIPDSAFLQESLRRGELPLWTPYIRLGQPFLATLQSQVFYPPRVLTVLLFGPVVGFTVQQVLHAVLACGGTYLAARGLAVRRLAATVAGVAFGLSPLLTDLAGQRNVVDAAAWTGLIVFAALGLTGRSKARRELAQAAREAGLTEDAYRALRAGSLGTQPRPPSAVRSRLRPALLLAFAVAMSIACGAPETVLWQALIVLALLARWVPRLLIGGGAFLWGAAAMAVVLVPAIEFVRNSTRGAAAADTLDWSASWAQLLGTVVPFAEQPRGPYWGGPDQWFVLTVFLGTTVALLAAGAGWQRRARPLWILLGVFVLLSAGRHFPPAGWLLQLPPFSLFRYPGKYLVALAFVVSLLAAVGLDRWAARARKGGVSVRMAALSLLLGAGLLAAGMPLLRLLGARTGAQGGWLWFCAALTLSLILFFAMPGRHRRGAWVGRALALVALAELGLFHFVQVRSGWTDPGPLSRPSVLAAALPPHFAGRISVGGLGHADPLAGAQGGMATHLISRDALLGNRFVEERLHALEGGWVPEMKRVEEFHLSGERAVFDLTGVSHYVRDAPPFPDLTKVAASEPRALYRSTTAMPRAFVVHHAEVVSDEDALRRVRDPAQPARRTAFLAEGAALPDPECRRGGAATIEQEGSNSLTVETSAECEGVLVLSDTWYPGWSATVDGATAPVLRANYALRAVRIPAGRHQVQFHYRPASFRWGAIASGVAWALLALAFGWSRRKPLAARQPRPG